MCHMRAHDTKIYRISWWMGHYGAKSAKPQQGWTNSRKFQHLDLGKYKHTVKRGKAAETVRKTINKKSGKVGWVGTKELKKTQPRTQFLP